jgi:phage shock protein C
VADRLYRSRDERIIGGVAGGMAENLDLDPAIVRIGWVLLAIVAPITPLFYLILMFVIPEEPEAPRDARLAAPTADAGATSGTVTSSGGTTSAATTPPAPNAFASNDRGARRQARRADRAARRGEAGRSGGLILGLLLVVVGGWFLVRQYFPRLDLGAYWPYVVIALGVVVIAAAMRPGGRSAD